MFGKLQSRDVETLQIMGMFFDLMTNPDPFKKLVGDAKAVVDSYIEQYPRITTIEQAEQLLSAAQGRQEEVEKLLEGGQKNLAKQAAEQKEKQEAAWQSIKDARSVNEAEKASLQEQHEQIQQVSAQLQLDRNIVNANKTSLDAREKELNAREAELNEKSAQLKKILG
jgi:ABC-type transporter Mla subunit MlaD